MKFFTLVASILATLLFANCSRVATGLDRKLDASSEEALKECLKSVDHELSHGQYEELKHSLTAIMSQELMTQKTAALGYEQFLNQVHGKTVREVIQMAPAPK